ncbi:MAG TPA: hypothetical protein VFY58_03175 [Nocardioides sp.]|nr:hypothetical protein [Nocardioides sp.]
MRGTSTTHWTLERPGLVMPKRVDPRGESGPTRMQARGPNWRRTSRGLYVPIEVDAGRPEQRIVEAAAVLPEYGGVSGWAALRWSGGFWFDGVGRDGQTLLPVTLAVGDSTIGSQPGIHVSEEAVRPEDLMTVDGLPVTTHVHAVSFLVRYSQVEREGVVNLDMAAYSDLVSLDEARRYALTQTAWTGIPKLRKAIDLADENSWSPAETTMRLIWMLDAGLPRPLSNHPVFDRLGRHVGTPDLLDPVAGVVGEYDGSLHLVGSQRRLDRDREERFRRVGLEYFTMLSGDGADRQRMAERMHAVRARARWAAMSRREWTVQLPPWWVPTFTVEQRRNLDDGQRTRFLRWRRRTA